MSIRSTLERFWNHSFFRFLLVGVMNTIVGLSATYLLLNALGLHYWVSTFLGNCIGAVVSYFLNKRFTFQSQASFGSSIWKFTAVILACYALSYWAGLVISSQLINLVNADQAAWADNLAVLIGAGLYTISNYFGQRFFAFRTPSAQQRDERKSS